MISTGGMYQTLLGVVWRGKDNTVLRGMDTTCF